MHQFQISEVSWLKEPRGAGQFGKPLPKAAGMTKPYLPLAVLGLDRDATGIDLTGNDATTAEAAGTTFDFPFVHSTARLRARPSWCGFAASMIAQRLSMLSNSSVMPAA